MSKDLLAILQNSETVFSKGQKCIADYILSHYEKAAYMTAVKLGNAAGVSESTVVRFAFTLGFAGYPELQEALREAVKNKLTAPQRMEVASNRMGGTDLLDRVLHADIQKIEKTLRDTSRESFQSAVHAIVNAKSIYILGTGSASILARFLGYYFGIVFPSVKLVNSSGVSELFEQIMRIGQEDIMISISFPRYSKRSVKATQFVKNRGAKVIAITDSDSSPLAKNADWLLKAQSDMASFVDSLVAPLSLINALIVAVAREKQEEIQCVFEELEAIWEEYEVYQKAGEEAN